MSARILVVDDQPVNRRLLEAKLTAEYYDVLTAGSGEEALSICAAQRPDVVLLDVMMPGLDGFETCRRLKAGDADIPVVMVTALSDVRDRVCGLEAGADDFLSKPIDDLALFSRVRSLVRLKRMSDEFRLRDELGARLSAVTQGLRSSDEPIRAARILLFAATRPVENAVRKALETAEMGELLCVSEEEAAVSALDETIELLALESRKDVDFLRLVSQLRAGAKTRHLPILLIAAPDEMPRVAKGLDLGANDYILTPIDQNELLARIRTQLRRKRLHDALRDSYRKGVALALTDPLTGLYNRRYASAHLDALLARAARGEVVAPAVVILDIDRFKTVNDTFGHIAGDAVLAEVGRRIAANIRDADLAARWGGEEFVVVLPGTGAEAARNLAERLRSVIAASPIEIPGGSSIEVTASFGVATDGPPDETTTGLVGRADAALYRAKHEGRNRVVLAEAA